MLPLPNSGDHEPLKYPTNKCTKSLRVLGETCLEPGKSPKFPLRAVTPSPSRPPKKKPSGFHLLKNPWACGKRKPGFIRRTVRQLGRQQSCTGMSSWCVDCATLPWPLPSGFALGWGIDTPANHLGVNNNLAGV